MASPEDTQACGPSSSGAGDTTAFVNYAAIEANAGSIIGPYHLLQRIGEGGAKL